MNMAATIQKSLSLTLVFFTFNSKRIFCVCSLSLSLNRLGVPRGFAFVEFSTEEEATRWMEYKQVS